MGRFPFVSVDEWIISSTGRATTSRIRRPTVRFVLFVSMIHTVWSSPLCSEYRLIPTKLQSMLRRRPISCIRQCSWREYVRQALAQKRCLLGISSLTAAEKWTSTTVMRRSESQSWTGGNNSDTKGCESDTAQGT